MSYSTGSAATFAEIETALVAACVAGGWTNQGSNVLTKGAAVAQVQSSSTAVFCQAFAGYSGSPTEPCDRAVYARNILNSITLTFPLTYHIHVLDNPDEVYLLINYNNNFWAWLAFGSSPLDGLPGTGNWVAGSTVEDDSVSSIDILTGGGRNYQLGNDVCPAPFWANIVVDSAGGGSNSYVHHDFDGAGWSSASEIISARELVKLQLQRQPNNWNGQAVLLPILPLIPRPSALFSYSVQFAHARYVRNDNLDDGDVLSLGPDQWKVYPFFSKDSDQRDGSQSTGFSSSGTFGWAIRYEVA